MITPNGGVFGRNPKFNTVTTQGGIVAGAASSIAGNLTLTGGNVVVSSGNGIDFTASGQAANVPAREATGNIVGTLTAPSDGDTVTVGISTYTFKTALTPVDGEVLIGASSQTALTNLTNAINGTGGVPGTDYQVSGANASATAAYTFSESIPGALLKAIAAGIAGNSIALSKSSTQITVNAFVGGANAQTNPVNELLNDYEEGAWNPLLFSTNVALAFVAMEIREARYIKIGRMVTLFASFTANIQVGSGTGSVRISGLPYAAASHATITALYPGAGIMQSWLASGPTHVAISPTQAIARLQAASSGANFSDITVANIRQSAGYPRNLFMFSVTYPVD